MAYTKKNYYEDNFVMNHYERMTDDFGKTESVKAVGTLVFTNAPAVSDTITLISTDGTSVTYTCNTDALGEDLPNNKFARSGASHGADSLKAAIEHANGHNGKITVSLSTTASVVTLTLTQIRGGASGNTTITDTLSSVTPTNFAGGIDYGATATLAFSNAPTAEEIITLTSATGTTKTYTCKSANSAAATATLVFTNAPLTDEVITIISTDGTSITYKCRGTPDLANNYFSRLADDHGAGGTTGLKAAIEHANGHNGKITVSLSSTSGVVTLLLTQAVGSDGDTTITSTLSHVTVTTFAGGLDQFVLANNQFSRGGSNHGADSLRDAIEHASGHNGEILTSLNESSNTLTLIQDQAGPTGNTAISSTLSNVTVTGFSGATKQNVPFSYATKGIRLRLNYDAYKTNLG